MEEHSLQWEFVVGLVLEVAVAGTAWYLVVPVAEVGDQCTSIKLNVIGRHETKLLFASIAHQNPVRIA